VFCLDRLMPTPAWLRLTIFISGTSLFAFFAPYWLNRWVLKHRRENQLARLISQKFPRLGDRLLGVLELSNQNESEATLSSALREAATKDVAAAAAQRDFSQALPNNRNRIGLTLVASLLIAAITAFIILPKAGFNALQRWLFPLSDTPRYTLTKFNEHLPSKLIVPLGEPFHLHVDLASDTETRPEKAKARYGAQNWLNSPRQNNTYAFKFPAQQSEGTVAILAGDARAKIKVIPTLPPTLESVEATVTYPDYLQLPPQLLDIRSGTLSILKGSDVQLHANASRTLARGQLEWRPFDSQTVTGDSTQEPLERLTASASSPRISYPPVSMPAHPAEIRLSWRDNLGLDGTERFRLRLESLDDEPPTIYMQGIERQIAILPEETLEFEILAEDDFGLQLFGLEWSGEFTKPSADSPANGEIILAEGAPDVRRLALETVFSPIVHDIAPQKLTLRAFTQDYLPDRGRIYSQPITLFILSRDEHAQLLKDKFDRLIGELEDAARKEQANLDENLRLERLDPNKLREKTNQDRLEKSRASEQENMEKMDEMSKRMEELFQDALRNGEIEEKTMQKLSQTQQKMRELAEQDLPDVEKQLRKSQDNRSTPEQSQKDLSKATEEQQEALKKMKDTLENANDANRDFEAATFVNRLKRAASEQDGIASSLQDSFERLAGLRSFEVDPSDERILGELAMQQKRTASDVMWIQEDLGHFYARTEKELHKILLDEMAGSGIESSLENNRERISRNLTFRSIVFSKKWANQLRAWAKMLEGDANGGGGAGGGGGGGGPSMEDQDFEFMLKVMRMIQTEQDIRARVRALEQLRRSLDNRGINPPSRLP
ncbi:MAG: hypothetical protein AAGC74_06525, partial [Verrucomicrobiota bacterium]